MRNRLFKKSFIAIICSLALVFTLAACGSNTNSNSNSKSESAKDDGNKGAVKPEYTFKLANVLAEKDVTGFGLNKLAELVEQKSNGRVKVEVFHGGQLGSGAETFEAVKNGHIDMAADSFANLAGITKAFEIFHMPFLFESREQSLKAFGSEKIRAQVDEELSSTGMKWYTSFEIGGPREIGTSKKKITSLEDLKGLKIRASRSPLEIASHEAWGAKGVTVDWPETPESVRMGMVDGLTVPYASFHSAKFHEGNLIKYMTDLNFQWYASVTVINRDKWEALPEDIKQILSDSASEAQEWHVNFVSEYITENVKEMKEKGVEIISLSDEEYNKIKDVTKEKVWGDFIGTEGMSQDKLNLILDEIGPVEEKGWGYKID